MSIKINDGLTRSSRTRARRRALGLCPDCGNAKEGLGDSNRNYSRCNKCRIHRMNLRKGIADLERIKPEKINDRPMRLPLQFWEGLVGR